MSEQQKEPKGPTQATRLVSMAENTGIELFRSPNGDAWASIRRHNHRESYPVQSKQFRVWLGGLYHALERSIPDSRALRNAVDILEGKAIYEGAEHPVFLRLAQYGAAVYLDLANDDWQAIEITEDGWQIVDDPPVHFRRPRGMRPLSFPAQEGSIDDFRRLLNLQDHADWILLVAWLLQALRPMGPYPVLILLGEQGSAKSTTSRLLRALIDPNAASARAAPRDTRDLMIAATNGWILGLDNLSRLPTWLSDSICRLSTGGGFATRELYTDAEEVIFDAQRPVILNAIEDLATRGDLLSRAIILRLPPIPDDARQTERALLKDFEDLSPGILGALLDITSAALKRLPQIDVGSLPRMADFARYIVAAEPSLGLESEAFLQIYRDHQESLDAYALEASPVSQLIIKLAEVEREGWTGTATQLLSKLGSMQIGRIPSVEIPQNPRRLSNTLRRVAPSLRNLGVLIEFGKREGGTGQRLITIRKI